MSGDNYNIEAPEKRQIDSRPISEQEYYERSTGLVGVRSVKKQPRGRKTASDALGLIAQRVLVGLRKVKGTTEYEGAIHDETPYNKRKEHALQAAAMTASGSWYQAKVLHTSVVDNFLQQTVTANYTPVTQSSGLITPAAQGMADPPLGIVNITGADKRNYLFKIPVPAWGTLKRIKVSAYYNAIGYTAPSTTADLIIYNRDPYANYDSSTGKSDVMGQVWEPNHIIYNVKGITAIAALTNNAIKQIHDDVPLYIPYLNEDIFPINQEKISEYLYARLIVDRGANALSQYYGFFIKLIIEENGEAELAVREGLKPYMTQAYSMSL